MTTLTQEQINYYSELMAKFEGWQLCQCGIPKEPHYKWGAKNWEVVSVKDLKYHKDRNWLHRVWEKFRDLKFEDDEYPDRYLFIVDQIRFKLTDDTLEEAFLELGKGLEWYYSLKNETFEKP